jgi:hypothetical protein
MGAQRLAPCGWEGHSRRSRSGQLLLLKGSGLLVTVEDMSTGQT